MFHEGRYMDDYTRQHKKAWEYNAVAVKNSTGVK